MPFASDAHISLTPRYQLQRQLFGARERRKHGRLAAATAFFLTLLINLTCSRIRACRP